jgi:cellulose synthase/poly-beta-1,6-N-acetylglucosamine synthase-like glycosyltransferase
MAQGRLATDRLEMTVVLFILVVPAVFLCGYHLFWGVVGLFLSRKAQANANPTCRFAILIPAHNEHDVLAKTLTSVAALDYPRDQLEVYVIADNCTDDTADIARSFGMNCLERFSQTERGKGFALAMAFPEILARTPADAVLVLDADCTVDSHALKAFDSAYRRYPKDSTCLQLNYVVGNPDASATSYLLAVANALENDHYYAPMSALNLPVLLRGTGMLIPRKILEAHPWSAFSIAEDTEYSLTVLQQADIRFIREAKVHADSPSEQKSLTVQRSRWIGGNFRFGIVNGCKLSAAGLLQLNARKWNTGMTLLTMSRPQVFFHLLLVSLLSAAYLLYWPGASTSLRPVLIGSLLGCWFGYFVYFVIGVCGLGLTSRRLSLLLRLPISMGAYLLMSIGSIIKKAPTRWTKTPR